MKCLLPAILVSLAIPVASQAALLISVYESGNDTYFKAQGTLNLAGIERIPVEIGDASFKGDGSTLAMSGLLDSEVFSASIEPDSGALFMTSDIPLPVTMYLYKATAIPAAFGSGGGAFADTYAANGSPNFGLLSDPEFFYGIVLEADSNDILTFNQSMVFSDVTIADLGIDEGSYVWEFSNGQTITMEVPDAFVPEPSTWAALIGSAALGLTLYRRRRSS